MSGAQALAILAVVAEVLAFLSFLAALAAVLATRGNLTFSLRRKPQSQKGDPK